MQNSTAMLDSTISKILANQQVEPSSNILRSPSPNSRNNQNQDFNDLPSESKIMPSKKAEVRLVVRFTVEEHIVYQGTVKKINQLENEELTRVVSHVAWDSIKDIDTAEPVSDTSKAADKETAHIELENHEKKSTNPSNPSESQHYHQEPDMVSAHSIEDVPNSFNSITDGAEVGEISQFDDHMIATETGVDIPIQTLKTTTTTTQQSSGLVNLDPNEDTIHDLNDSLKQTQKQDSKTYSDSDTNIEQRPLNCTRTFGDDSQIAPDILEPTNMSPIKSDEEVFHEAMECVRRQALILDEDTYIEDQSIYDTLNDCINNVARETLFLDKMGSSPSTSELDTPISIEADSFRQQGSPDLKESSDELSTIDRNSNGSSLHTDLGDKILADDESQPLSNEPSGTSSPVSTETSNEADKTPSVKRESSNDYSSGKKMKRGTPKEQKNSVSRKGTQKTYENLVKKNRSSSTRAGSTMSLLVTKQQQIRQNKVFAKWSDNHFYPGVIIRPAKDRKFVIGFVDGAQKDVAETDLIPLCNIEGKQVRIQIAKNYCYNAIVHDQLSTVNDQPMFEVEYQQNGLVKKCVSWKDIFLTGEQGIPLANQLDRNSSASNFVDVDLDNIIHEKRSRRLQEMEEFYFTNSSPHRTKTSLLL